MRTRLILFLLLFCLTFKLSAQTDSTAKYKTYVWGQFGLNYSLSNNSSDLWGVNAAIASKFLKNNYIFFEGTYQVRLRNSFQLLGSDETSNCVTSRKNISISYGKGIKISDRSSLIFQLGILLGTEYYRGEKLGYHYGKGWFSIDEAYFKKSKATYLGFPVKLTFQNAILASFGVKGILYANLLSPNGDYGLSLNVCFGKIRKKLRRNNSPFR